MPDPRRSNERGYLFTDIMGDRDGHNDLRTLGQCLRFNAPISIDVERRWTFPRLIPASHDFLDRNQGQAGFWVQTRTRCKGYAEMAVGNNPDRLR